MPATLTTIDAALKETWTEERLAEQLYNENPLLSRVKRLKNTKVGQQAQTAIHTGRNHGFTALPAAGGTLNAAGQQGAAQATWQYKHFHQQVKIQGSAIDGTASDAQSIAEVVDIEVTGALDDLNRQLTRMTFLNGDALTAQCGTTTASTTIQLNVTSGVNALERGWIAVGSRVDIGTTANEVSIVDANYVVAVDETNGTIQVSATEGGSAVSVTTSSSHYVSLANSRAGTTSYEMNGLRNVVSATADLGGLTVSSNPVWKAANVDSTAQALSLALIYAQDRKVMQKTGKESTFKLTGLKQAEAAYKLGQAQVRFAGDRKVEVGNIDAFDIAGQLVHRHPDCPNEDFYFLTIDDLLIVSAGDPYWQSKVTGGGTLEWIQGEDSYGGKLTTRLNLGTRRRSSHAVLSGLS